MDKISNLLPFTDPVIVFTLLVLIMLIAPILFRKFRIPGLIGLIIAGMIVGPHALNLIGMNESINLLSTAGLIYLMFLAGLELDMRDFIRSRNRSLVFGALTFFIPLIFGFFTAYFILKHELVASLLIASMFSTHTLISFPIVSRMGITKSEAVTVTIGGTIITDTAVLVLLAFISAGTTGSLSLYFWIKIIASISAFAFIILWGIPKISVWFFKHMEAESGSQYIFVLVLLFASALLAHLAGIEPIIGAFLAGLSLSSIIPRTSALMNRISFIGNNLFIPIFIISVGMMVDFDVLLNDWAAITFSIVLVIVALISKYLAAYATQKIFRYTKIEREVIFGMSVSHAAAIIAVVIVGYNLKLIGLDVLNGAILIILVSSLLGTVHTEHFGKKLAIAETAKAPVYSTTSDRILVPVSNPATIDKLLEFAILMRSTKSKQPLYMLSVIPDDKDAIEKIRKNSTLFDSLISTAASMEVKLSHVTRVDINIANGIAKAAKELLVDKMVLGWNGKITTTNFFFGSIMENLLSASDQMVVVVKLLNPLNSINRIIVSVPEHSYSESGFAELLDLMQNIADHTSSSLVFCSETQTLESIKSYYSRLKHGVNAEYEALNPQNFLSSKCNALAPTDLLVVVSARIRTISYNSYLDNIPRDLSKQYETNSFIIIYPEQKSNETIELNDASNTVIDMDMNAHSIDKLLERYQSYNSSKDTHTHTSPSE